MSYRHMEIFLMVCKCGNNLTRAAERLYISQPAVSLAINELESFYNVKLFDRLAHRLSLTEAGKALLEQANAIQSLWQDTTRMMQDWDAGGLLRVGASISIGAQLMPQFVCEFSTAHPATDIRVFIEAGNRLEQTLLNNELDLALTEGIVHNQRLVVEPFMEDRLVIVCAPSQDPSRELSKREFLTQRLLLREPGSGTRDLFDNVMRAAGLAPQPMWESVSTAALINAVRYGLGVAVLPQRMVAELVRQGELAVLQVQGLDFSRCFNIVYHQNKYLSANAKAFIELCRTKSALSV